MSIVLDGTSGITSPGGDTATVSVATPILKSPSSLTLQTNGSTNAVIINTSQNVGLGATPASWGVGGPVVEFKNPGNAVFNNGTSDMWVAANMVYNSGWTYGSNGKASGAEVTDGGMLVYAANTGTAGASASLTQLTSVKIGQTFALQGANQTAGTGIAFPATQSASSDANTLDDYEEGSWTPSFTGSSSNPTVTYGDRVGSYTKVGRLVTCIFRVAAGSASGGSGNIQISGLPFSMATGQQSGFTPMQAWTTPTSNRYVALYLNGGTNYLTVYNSDPNGAFGAAALPLINGFDVICSFSYFTS